jgi:allantoicase
MSERWIAAMSDPEVEALARRLVDLAHPRLGTQVTFATDDFFAPKERLIDPAPPIFMPGKYDDHGKWMDGWESRRKRTPGHDCCVIRLGAPGRIRAVDIDTSFFTGNYPPEAMLEASGHDGSPKDGPGDGPGDDLAWHAIVPRRPLEGDRHNLAMVADEGIWRWLRLHIYPDGGVARLRIFGEIHKDWSRVAPDEEIDLAALVNGGVGLAWSDAHYGLPANMLAPGRGRDMGDGWETARRRGPGNDWAVLRLGHPGRITRAVVDTAHFKGNYPDRCALRAARLEREPEPATLGETSAEWPLLLPETRLAADSEQVFAGDLADLGAVSHVRLDIFPDGGVSRLRLFGRIAP